MGGYHIRDLLYGRTRLLRIVPQLAQTRRRAHRLKRKLLDSVDVTSALWYAAVETNGAAER